MLIKCGKVNPFKYRTILLYSQKHHKIEKGYLFEITFKLIGGGSIMANVVACQVSDTGPIPVRSIFIKVKHQCFRLMS